MKTYFIENKGKKHHYATLDDARKVCNEIFEKTGIVMGIEESSEPIKNTDYIASGEYEGEFYLIEKSGLRGAINICRHSDGSAYTCTYKGTGFTSLTDLRNTVKKLGEEKVIKTFAVMGKYAKWGPMYKAEILRDSESAKKYF